MNEELIINNINLIYLMMKKFGVYHLMDEYYDVGMIGLVKACKNYNTEKGYKFTTYACRCISNEILIEKRKQNTSKRNGTEISMSTVVYSNGDNDITLEEMIPSSLQIEEEIIHKDDIYRLKNEILNLTEREQAIISLYYGIGAEKKTQKEIARITGRSQAQISRSVSTIIEKLRKGLVKYDNI